MDNAQAHARTLTAITDSLTRRNELERRFDGPIPSYLLETDADRSRKQRGAISLVQSMVADFRVQEKRLCNEIAALQLKQIEHGLTAEDEKMLAYNLRVLDRTRRNIESME
jgi:hypothetical protein